MSEFWVSHKRYRCQYCDIWIADDAPSRQQHENGLRHKGNRDRFIKSLYKQGEKQIKEREEERREMAAIDKAANAAYATDVGAGRGSQSALAAPVASSSKPKAATAPASTNKWANYSTAASLGYTDPDVERALQEAQLRQNEGVAGAWQVVTPDLATLAAQATAAAHVAPSETEAASTEKRARSQEDDEGGRAYKVRKKTAAVGLGELWEPGVIKVKVKVKEPPEEVTEETTPGKKEEMLVKEEDAGDGGMKPKWGKRWSTVDQAAEEQRIKEEMARQEERFLVTKEEEKGEVKEEQSKPTEPLPEPEPEPPSAGLFKKRKGPAAGVKHGRPRP